MGAFLEINGHVLCCCAMMWVKSWMSCGFRVSGWRLMNVMRALGL